MSVATKKRAVSPSIRYPLRCACIDIGSNAIRFMAVEYQAHGSATTLAFERLPVRLGHSVFFTGRIDSAAMNAAVKGMGMFSRLLRQHAITHYRAVATSAVRESANGVELVERAKKLHNLDIEIISGSEEARLGYEAIKSRMKLGAQPWIAIDVGGGSVEVSLIDAAGIRWSQSHPMGAVRLLEILTNSANKPQLFNRLLTEYVTTLRLPDGQVPVGMIAMGGSIEALARMVRPTTENDRLAGMSVAQLRSLVKKLSACSYEQRINLLGLKPDRADIIVPAALVYLRIAQQFHIKTLTIPGVGLREGLLVDLVKSLTGGPGRKAAQEKTVVAAALSLGRRYLFDEAHGRQVSFLAGMLFDQLADLHGMGGRERLLLTTAAILHDIGTFIGVKGHHKHSRYAIAQAELPYMSSTDMQLVAAIARYHRKREPTVAHPEFAALPANNRRIVSRLAPILRLADALDREHLQQVKKVTARLKDTRVVLSLSGRGDMLLEQWALRTKALAFERTYGRTVICTTAALPTTRRRSAP